MFAKIQSLGVFALNGFLVTVEADTSGGLPRFDIVGLPDNAVKEAGDRVRSALKNSGFTYPVSRITVNLAPADTRKTGPVYDLPILLALLATTGQIPAQPAGRAYLGELSLDGEIRPVAGALAMAIAARKNGIKELFCPAANAAEAAVVEGLSVYPCRSAAQVAAHLRGEREIGVYLPEEKDEEFDAYPDFSDVRGQYEARRALEIAAAGGHNVLMIGPPGTGKSMLAKRMPGILPPMTRAEAIETTSVYSVAGKLPAGSGLMRKRPFRSPHHSVSTAGLAGGGSVPHPGEISLAHNGVLFLDELPEFRRDALEVLRQPLEDGVITLSRAQASAAYPCRVMLVAAMNPCPCGYFGHPVKRCSCTPSVMERYLQRVSGPLLDRIDLHVEVQPVEYEALSASEEGEPTAEILKRVAKAREIQQARYAGTQAACNAQLSGAQLREACVCTPQAQTLLKGAFERLGLSARGYDRVLKVSRTIADLEGSEVIGGEHIAEALQYRNLDRKYWNG
ncbi:MAG: YifB family Mg chelatase-like AAA ATPase [Oscillospiraceae bacterium]|nr:YifB family Mg chelatase-like AAA ATPase [Oscillospiraceae bacterium]